MRTVFCTQYSVLSLKHLNHTAVTQLNHRLDLSVCCVMQHRLQSLASDVNCTEKSEDGLTCLRASDTSIISSPCLGLLRCLVTIVPVALGSAKNCFKICLNFWNSRDGYTMTPWVAAAMNLPLARLLSFLVLLLLLLCLDPQQTGRRWVLSAAAASPCFAGRGRVSWFTLAEASIAQEWI